MNIRNRKWIEGAVFLTGFAACIPLANFMIGHIGTVCVPDGPCLIPVGPGLTAPSGVLLVGLALVLRDLVQRRLGLMWAIGAIIVGAFLSTTFTAPSLAVASASAFLTSELADLLVFTPLQKKGLVRAAFVSSVVGLIVDSVMFLWLAFGSLDFLAGQVFGKLIMVVAALPVLFWIRNRDRRLGLMPA
ncbi:VUT family protein [Sinorhizobium meliloti]|nr:VUT family protein [Sinorhizobium meliloti]MDW9721649.1 VUT family protein [Sinorhizobium meliloti]MDW9728210.1 VUT family protein [Sinorhizobium meliloti]MDW9746754.1 VUT family protein [Sinorhizobium meliloti]